METGQFEVNGFMLPAKFADAAMKTLAKRTNRLVAVPEIQQALSFVTTNERAQMVTAYAKHQEQSKRSDLKVQLDGFKLLNAKIKEGHVLSYDEAALQRLLSSPLIGSLSSELDEPQAAEIRSSKHIEPRPKEEQLVAHRSEVSVPPDEHPIAWTDDEVYMLTEGILIHTLEVLKSRGNIEGKIEALDWIWASDIHSYRKVRINDQVVQEPVLSKFIPFTFAFCCVINGLDPDAVRESIRRPLAPVIRQLGLDEHIAFSR